MTNKLFIGMLCAMLFSACTQDDVLGVNEEIPTTKTRSVLSTQKAQIKFAKILSKAVSANVDLRRFLKEEAMRQFDNDYDVFYPLVKDKIVTNGKTFRDILLSYCEGSNDLKEIEQSQELLNILIPDLTLFWDFNADKWNPEQNEIVVICRSDEDRTMFENGETIGNLDKNEIPGFPCLVIKDNERMKVVNKQTRSGNIVYAFSDAAFDGSKRIDKPLTRSSWDQAVEATEDLTKPIQASEFKADIVEAWKELKDVKHACQRDYIYYGFKKDNKPGDLNRNIREELYRFNIKPNAFKRIADQQGSDPSLQNTTQKKRYLTNEELLDRIWKDGNFEICFKSYIASKDNSKSMENTLVFSIRPRDLFTIEKVNIHHRHSTGFRHSKNVYSVSPDNLRAKWYYPSRSDKGNLVFVTPWDLYDHAVSIFMFVEEVDDVQEEKYTKTLMNQFTDKADFAAGIDGGSKFKYNAKLSYGFSKLHSESSEATIITQKGSDNLGVLSFFFYDPIIRYQDNGGYQLMNVSGGDVQATILPRDLLRK